MIWSHAPSIAAVSCTSNLLQNRVSARSGGFVFRLEALRVGSGLQLTAFRAIGTECSMGLGVAVQWLETCQMTGNPPLKMVPLLPALILTTVACSLATLTSVFLPHQA